MIRNAAGQPPLTEQQKAQLMKNPQLMKDAPHMVMQPGAKRLGGPAGIQTGRKPTPGERKPRDASNKSPTMRRPKEITYARLRMVQQYFKGNELKSDEDNNEAGAEVYNADKAEDAAKTGEEGENAEEKGKQDGADGADQNDEEKKAIDGSNQETAVDDRGEENHEEYNQSEIDAQEYANTVYDPNDVIALDINTRSKAKQLQRLILDKKNLKKANIILYKQVVPKAQ